MVQPNTDIFFLNTAHSLAKRDKFTRAILFGLLAIASLPVIIPSIFLIMWSIFGTETIGFLSESSSLIWFKKVLLNSEWQESLIYSLILGIFTAGIGCIVLTVHFFFLRRVTRVVETLTYTALILTAVIPPVIFALSLRLFGADAQMPEYTLMAIGHLAFVLPVQYFVFETSQENIPSEMLESAITLGASPFRALLMVFVPSVIGAIRSAFIVGFFFSFDEIVIAAFVIDSPIVTVPKRLWDNVHRSMEPDPAVIATILLLLYIAIIFSMLLLLITRKRGAR